LWNLGKRDARDWLALDLYSLTDYIICVKKTYSLTEAKARFSKIVDRLIHDKEIIVITKKREKVAVLIPYDQYCDLSGGESDGLLQAVGALAGYEDEVDEMMRIIMEARNQDRGREVDL
jgi:prevent-host-death family protein